MSKSVRYLIRKLAILKNDGQFQNYRLVYLNGEIMVLPEEGECLRDITVITFDKERPGATYIDTLTLRELSDSIWKII